MQVATAFVPIDMLGVAIDWTNFQWLFCASLHAAGVALLKVDSRVRHFGAIFACVVMKRSLP